jgi:hypothetical protein
MLERDDFTPYLSAIRFEVTNSETGGFTTVKKYPRAIVEEAAEATGVGFDGLDAGS